MITKLVAEKILEENKRIRLAFQEYNTSGRCWDCVKDIAMRKLIRDLSEILEIQPSNEIEDGN